MIMIGVYAESIIIPDGVCICGTLNTIISKTVSTSSLLVQMGVGCCLKDITLVITPTNSSNITGVLFGNGCANSSKIISVNIQLSTNGDYSGLCTGINCTDTTSGQNILYFDNILDCNISLLSTNNTLNGSYIGIYNTGTSYFSMRNSNVSCSGQGTHIAIRNNSTGYLSVKNCMLNGITNDISRVSGNLSIIGTDLVNSLTDGNGFSGKCSIVSLGMSGITIAATKYLAPGNLSFGDLLSIPYNIYFPNICIVNSISIFTTTLFSGSWSIALSFYKNSTSNTPFLTSTLNASTLINRVSNLTQTFLTTDCLIIKTTLTGFLLNANITNLTVMLSLY